MDVVDLRPVVMMPWSVVMTRSAMMAVPVGPTTRAIMMRPRAPRIGPNVCMMIGSMMACAMEARTMLAVPPLAFAVRPGISC